MIITFYIYENSITLHKTSQDFVIHDFGLTRDKCIWKFNEHRKTFILLKASAKFWFNHSRFCTLLVPHLCLCLCLCIKHVYNWNEILTFLYKECSRDEVLNLDALVDETVAGLVPGVYSCTVQLFTQKYNPFIKCLNWKVREKNEDGQT